MVSTDGYMNKVLLIIVLAVLIGSTAGLVIGFISNLTTVFSATGIGVLFGVTIFGLIFGISIFMMFYKLIKS